MYINYQLITEGTFPPHFSIPPHSSGSSAHGREPFSAQRGVFVFLRSIAQRWRSERQFMSHKGQGRCVRSNCVFLIHFCSLDQLCAGPEVMRAHRASPDGSLSCSRHTGGVWEGHGGPANDYSFVKHPGENDKKEKKIINFCSSGPHRRSGQVVHVCCVSRIGVIYSGMFLMWELYDVFQGVMGLLK